MTWACQTFVYVCALSAITSISREAGTCWHIVDKSTESLVVAWIVDATAVNSFAILFTILFNRVISYIGLLIWQMQSQVSFLCIFPSVYSDISLWTEQQLFF